MTLNIDPDRAPMLPFDPSQVNRCGVRMTRAELARFLGVSKQAVGDWVRAGKVALGSDGRLDPRVAVSQLLRTTDPARLRSKVLAPLLRDNATLQRRNTDLAAELAASREDAEFHEGACRDLMAEFDLFHEHMRNAWPTLRELPSDQGIAAMDAWVATLTNGGDPGLILDYVGTTVRAPVEEGGAGDAQD